MAKSITFNAALAPAVVLTLTPDTVERAEFEVRPISAILAASSAKLWVDWKLTTPCTVADVVAPPNVTVLVPPAASVPVPANEEIEMFWPDDWVSTSLLDELTVATMPVALVWALIA